jgi:type IV pilus assembly protein PilQ
MIISSKARVAHRLIAGCAIAAAVTGGMRLAAAPAESIRLVGVSSQAAGKAAAVLIEAAQPVAYSVSRPDPLTLSVDLRNVTVGDAAAKVTKTAPLAGVTLEQATGANGESLARVRVALTSPATYTVRSDRNVIRLELEPGKPEGRERKTESTAVLPGMTDTKVTAPAATRLEKVRASQTKNVTTVTLAGNGRLTPSSLAESDDQPRRLVLDFPNVSPATTARTAVDSAYVKAVRVALNSRDPLVTRVVMEITATATYHVERTGPDGRDLAVVFEPPSAAGALLIAPGTSSTPAKQDDEKYTMEQALANAASLIPREPITALVGPPTPTPAPASTKPAAPAPAQKPAPSTSAGQPPQNPPAPPQNPTTPPQNPTTPPQNPPAGQSTFTSDVPGTGQRQYVGAPVNFDFEDADLRAVLRLFSQFSGLNMIIDPAVQGRVNVLLNDVPWDQALEQILRSNKLGYNVDGNIMRIAPIAVLADEQSQTQKLNEAKALAGELQVRTFALSYAKADAVAPILTRSALSARGQVQVDARTNTMIITDLPDRIQTAQGLIVTLDRPQPQVEVDARIVQTSRDFARALGIQWGFNGRSNAAIGNTTGLTFPNNGSIGGRVGATQAGNGGTQGPTDPRGGTAGDNTATVVNLPAAGATSAIGLALGSINGAFNLDVQLSALESSGKGRILSEPRLATQNNQTAVVRQGVQIPVQTVANNTVTTTFVNADLSLTVTPQITAANTVIMNLVLTNSSPDFTHSVQGTPPINTQSASTTIQVTDGATAVIGGIFVTQEQSNNDRTPGLYRVPILKWLFQHESLTDSSRELLIFITPKIQRG